MNPKPTFFACVFHGYLFIEKKDFLSFEEAVSWVCREKEDYSRNSFKPEDEKYFLHDGPRDLICNDGKLCTAVIINY